MLFGWLHILQTLLEVSYGVMSRKVPLTFKISICVFKLIGHSFGTISTFLLSWSCPSTTSSFTLYQILLPFSRFAYTTKSPAQLWNQNNSLKKPFKFKAVQPISKTKTSNNLSYFPAVNGLRKFETCSIRFLYFRKERSTKIYNI